jgi:hypothetical protein
MCRVLFNDGLKLLGIRILLPGSWFYNIKAIKEATLLYEDHL